MNETLNTYRIEQLEEKVEQLDASVRELLTELKATKKAGRWFMAAAMAVGGFITWAVKSLGIAFGGSQ